jgi:hypothetical protein
MPAALELAVDRRDHPFLDTHAGIGSGIHRRQHSADAGAPMISRISMSPTFTARARPIDVLAERPETAFHERLSADKREHCCVSRYGSAA